MTDQGSTPPPPDPDQPAGQPGGYGAPPPSQPYGQTPGYGQAPPPGPGYGGPGGPGGSPPPNYLVWAILTTVLCCLPLGVASIVFAAQVNSKYGAGDVVGAQEASQKAKKFAIWSAVAGLIVGVIYLLVVVAVGVGGSSD